MLIVIFPADENETEAIIKMNASITIFDDDINEAEEQIFIILLEVVDLVNPDAINIQLTVASCHIIDNDGKSSNSPT